jgi:4'-phosphopantetheinyl transferase
MLGNDLPDPKRAARGAMRPLAVSVDPLRDPTVEVWHAQGPEAVRAILARYAGCAAEELRLGATSRGKPVVRFPPGRPVCFSAARSGRDVVVAVGRANPVGVDIEAVRDLDDLGQAVDAVLASDERELVYASSPVGRLRARYCAWTRKEAFLKAIGIGFAIDPRRVAILPACDARAPAHHEVRVDGEIVDWRVIDLDVGPIHVAALSGPGDDHRPAEGAC